MSESDEESPLELIAGLKKQTEYFMEKEVVDPMTAITLMASYDDATKALKEGTITKDTMITLFDQMITVYEMMIEDLKEYRRKVIDDEDL